MNDDDMADVGDVAINVVHDNNQVLARALRAAAKLMRRGRSPAAALEAVADVLEKDVWNDDKLRELEKKAKGL